MFGGQGRSFNAFWKDSFLADPWCEIGGTNNNQRGNGNRSQDGAAVLPPPMMPPPPSMLLIPANDLQQQHPVGKVNENAGPVFGNNFPLMPPPRGPSPENLPMPPVHMLHMQQQQQHHFQAVNPYFKDSFLQDPWK
mmetsp:Transcript_20733/g.25137  ORF Transcript_20733/g.25137 Transcript_20733/m.25137 type:complete len:136 (+) Transcript_20733:528-935(+)|eukprot:CAMPEP_0204823986 /NCGR_PEP_ID=MMETSP1346-20131115/2046_1 /ASSEMBLY_ACC=CAM_ASM_000771 /TAXON_ID=215587 /ORGANISM="Aplanochytrium stocchinoi, Strain GSBS06" /LENGTH=135 /DNA_ID=CAMNT_0051950901 /DNA_START=485 /DNA_END=892 /DNA_ORIENTATION=+